MLQNLLLEKLVKEYDFLQSEIKYKKAVIDYYLPELKPTKAETDKIVILPSKIDEIKEKYMPSNIEKQIWRQISKITHPDKAIENNKFHDAYSAYSSGDFLQLLKIAQDLKLEVKINNETFDIIKSQIKTLNSENYILDQHIIWQWYHATGDIKEILLDKIKNI
jgi:hypothetical protein